MLSLLIPTYDFTCYSLVADLHQQAETLGIPYEIIVAEDGSRSQVDIIANHKIEELSHCHHHIRKENIGLASTRNELVTIAQYEWLLIIDSDAVVEKPDFLRTYIQAIGKAEVVLGTSTLISPYASSMRRRPIYIAMPPNATSIPIAG